MNDQEANEEVPCPACKGRASGRVRCHWCDGDGVLPHWVAVAITTDGIVR